MIKPEEKKQIFLSYGGPDKGFVRRLSADLRKLGIAVWFDEWEVKVGDSITGAINQAIAKSSFFGAVLSDDSVSRPWVQKELQTAMHYQVEQQLKILPILVTECKNIPPFIRELRYADFSGAYQVGLRDLVLALDPAKAADVNLLIEDISVSTKTEWFVHEFSLEYLKKHSNQKPRYYFPSSVMNQAIFETILKELQAEHEPLSKAQSYSLKGMGSPKSARAFVRDDLSLEAIDVFYNIYFPIRDDYMDASLEIKHLFLQGDPAFEELLFATAKAKYELFFSVYPTFDFVNEKLKLSLIDKILGYFEIFSLFEQAPHFG